MTDLVVNDDAVVLGWKDGFRVLAVEQGQPLLELAGAPEGIARSPAAAMECARRFLFSLREVWPVRSVDDPNYLRPIEQLLRMTFEKLSRAYGRETSDALRDWLLHNFVLHEERMRWWLWSQLLPMLADISGGGPKVPSPLSPSALDRFGRVVGSYFGRDVTAEDQARQVRARMKGLSPLELSIVTIKASGHDEVDEQWDVVSELTEILRNERTRRAWQGISDVLEPAERALFLAWARDEGARRKMPLELIVPG